MPESWIKPQDLAPGDLKSKSLQCEEMVLHTIKSERDPGFPIAFAALQEEFGAAGEIEEKDVLLRRMQWNPAILQNGCALCYRLMLVCAHGKLAAVRDHTAIVFEHTAVVHLSHNLIAPEWRRTGLAGWLRALPVETARDSLAAQHLSLDTPIILVAEMEHADRSNALRMARLMAYEKAGFRKIDPSRIPYQQPDFRSATMIDASNGPRCLPLSLVVRRIGREQETTISGKEARIIVEGLYRMYGLSFRKRDIAPLLTALSSYPSAAEEIALIPPTQESAP